LETVLCVALGLEAEDFVVRDSKGPESRIIAVSLPKGGVDLHRKTLVGQGVAYLAYILCAV